MIFKIVIIFFIFLVVFLLASKIAENYKRFIPKNLSKIWPKLLKYLVIILLLTAVIYIVLTGKIQLVWVLLLGAIPWIRRSFFVWRGFGFFNQFRNTYAYSSFYQKRAKSKLKMSKEMAAEILGVDLDDDMSVIQKAYIKKMQKVHPDKGGSKKDAQKLNLAREVLQNYKKT